MRSTCVLFSVLTVACGQPGEPGALAPGESQTDPLSNASPAQGPEGQTPNEPAGCAYSETVPAVELTPGDYCRVEHRDADGEVVKRVERTVTIADDVETVTIETFVVDGTLVERSTLSTGPHGVVARTVERPTLPPLATLPDTYGAPATWGEYFDYDEQGRKIASRHDIGLDGVEQTGVTWAYQGDVVVKETTLNTLGEVYYVREFRSDGQPTLAMDGGGYGKRWTYDDAGLLMLEEKLSADKVLEVSEWQMAGIEKPLHRLSFTLYGGEKEQVGEHTWFYNADGQLTRDEGTGTISGHLRSYLTEYDAEGREVHYIEDTESKDCHRYEKVTTYTAGGALLDVLTTCDGGLFEHIEVTLDSAERAVHQDRIFIGNPNWIVKQSSDWEYDACGAQTLFEHRRDGQVLRRDVTRHDSAGRITQLIRQTGTTAALGEPVVTDYTYDQAGRLVGRNDTTWTLDAQGRLSQITQGDTSGARYLYDCQ